MKAIPVNRVVGIAIVGANGHMRINVKIVTLINVVCQKPRWFIKEDDGI